MIPLPTAAWLAIKIIAPLLLVAALFGAGWRAGANHMRADWEAETLARNAEQAAAAVAHAQSIARRDATIQDIKDNLERRHHDDNAKLRRALDDARRTVAAAGGLRDPGARPGADCANLPAAADGAGHGDAAAGGARLSAEADRFLLDLAGEADAVVAQLERCRAWAMSLDAVQNDSPRGDDLRASPGHAP